MNKNNIYEKKKKNKKIRNNTKKKKKKRSNNDRDRDRDHASAGSRTKQCTMTKYKRGKFDLFIFSVSCVASFVQYFFFVNLVLFVCLRRCS
jgi:hypothetical protein